MLRPVAHRPPLPTRLPPRPRLPARPVAAPRRAPRAPRAAGDDKPPAGKGEDPRLTKRKEELVKGAVRWWKRWW